MIAQEKPGRLSEDGGRLGKAGDTGHPLIRPDEHGNKFVNRDVLPRDPRWTCRAGG